MPFLRQAIEGEFGEGQIDGGFFRRANDFPRFLKPRGQIQFLGENIDRPEWEDSQACGRATLRFVANPIQYFIQCTVASRSYDSFKALAHSLGGEQTSRTNRDGRLQRALVRQRVERSPKS